MNAHDFCLIVDSDRELLAILLRAADNPTWSGLKAEQKAEDLILAGPSRRRLASKIARLALSRVDWDEVAEHYRTKVQEGASA